MRIDMISLEIVECRLDKLPASNLMLTDKFVEHGGYFLADRKRYQWRLTTLFAIVIHTH